MRVKIVDDINIKALDGEFEGYFYLYPNSVRRDITFDFIAPTGARKRKDKPFTGKELG